MPATDPATCPRCHWQGTLADCVNLDCLAGVDYCPDCGALVEVACDEPVVLTCEPDADSA